MSFVINHPWLYLLAMMLSTSLGCFIHGFIMAHVEARRHAQLVRASIAAQKHGPGQQAYAEYVESEHPRQGQFVYGSDGVMRASINTPNEKGTQP